MKLTKDQMRLLKDLNDSFGRGAASLSCGQRKTVIAELVKLKIAELHPSGHGYRITELGRKNI